MRLFQNLTNGFSFGYGEINSKNKNKKCLYFCPKCIIILVILYRVK